MATTKSSYTASTKKEAHLRKAISWFDSKNHPHATLPECQAAELEIIGFHSEQAELIVKQTAKVLNILNVNEKSRLSARKLNGAKRKSRVKPEQPSLPAIASTDKPF